MGETAARGRAARLLAVLAVLLGLLAMHGLASTHHAAAAAPAAHAALPAAEAEAEAGRNVHRHGAAPVAVPAQAHGAAPLAGDGASCDDDCPDIAMLCVAVLTGAALALLLARERRPVLLPASAHPRAATRAPPVRMARGPDPVRELCISRT